MLEAREVRVQAAHDLARLGLHARVVEGAQAGRQLAAEEQVARRIDVVGQGQRLVDRLDVAAPWRRAGCGCVTRLAVDQDLAGVGRVGARQHPHERRLAGAVAADEADDLPGVQIDRYVAHGVDAAEGDVDVAHLDERRALRDGHGRALLAAQEPRRRLQVSRPTARIRTMPGHDVLAGRVDADEAQPVGERLHDEGAQDGARDGPDAARERGAADDGGRDDVQLVALADVEGRAVEPRGRDGRREGAQDAHQDVGLQDRPAGVDAGQLGRVGVAAVGVDVPAEPPPGGDEGHDEGHADEQDDRVREAGRDLPAARGGRSPVLLARRPGWPGPSARGWRWRRRPGPARPGSRRRRAGPRPTSGRSGKPKRRRWRRPLMSSATIARQPTRPRIQVSVPPDGSLGPAADELEGGVEAGDGGATGEVPDDAADRQQPAEGDDERGHADVGDDEALERPDERRPGRRRCPGR